MVKTAPLRSVRLRGDDRAAHRLDEAAARSRGRARCRRAPDRSSARGRTCRRCARGPPAECRRLRRARAARPRRALRQLCDADRSVPAGAYFAALSSRLNSTCSNSTASSSSIGRSGASSSSTLWCARILPARRSALPTISPRSCSATLRRDGAGFEPGHVEQVGDEAVEALGLVDDCRTAVRAFSASLSVWPMIAQRAGGAQHGGKRRLADRARSRSAAPSAAARSRRRARRGPCPRRDRRARWRARPDRAARRAAGAGRA